MKLILALILSLGIVGHLIMFAVLISSIVFDISYANIRLADVIVALIAYFGTAAFLYGHLTIRNNS